MIHREKHLDDLENAEYRGNVFDRTLPVHVAGGMLFKYEQLDEALGGLHNVRSKGTHVNVIIDIEPILRSCAVKQFVYEYSLMEKADKDLIIIYALMKVVAHYRRYFSRAGIHSKVYCYHSLKPSSHATDLMDKEIGNLRLYKFSSTPFYSKSIEDDILKALKKFSVICKNTIGVYSICTNNIFAPSMPHLIMEAQKESKGQVGGNFIISSNPLVYQYASINYKTWHDDVLVLNPQGRNVLSSDTIIEAYLYSNHKKWYKDNKLNTYPMTPYYIQLVAVLGIPKIGVPSCRAGTKTKIFDFFLNELPKYGFDEMVEKICEFLKTSTKQEQFKKNMELCDVTMMGAKSTQAELTLLNHDIMDFTGTNISRQLSMLFGDKFASSNFVIINFLRG